MEYLLEMMVGRYTSFKVNKKNNNPGNTILNISNLFVMNNKKVLALKNFSLKIRQGEIIGIVGVNGDGQIELVEAITGMRKIDKGKVEFINEEKHKFFMGYRTNKSIPCKKDKNKKGLILDYTLESNILLQIYNKKTYSKKRLLNKKSIKIYNKNIIKDFHVKSSKQQLNILRSLSFINIKKNIICKKIELQSEIVIAVQPTKNLDKDSIDYIHKRLIKQRNLGKGVLLISSQLDEILNLSDRIVIINNGELVNIVNTDEINEKEIDFIMTKIKN
ncbi:ATP-binding cassette domain-containing protein [Clostridium tarantellae]|uniref:ATP-binding cassette domain-containing protein n=1 Tax=Clostridium tarantellae TaxID=39493 RepID=A0A6I1MN00_9CLOT|nr:ATP-binding cassette domain-containing protein [Clostridium tarantellae]MPQ43848.1 ATP-binding cassette domain-containing protein [Clostridium tarantellae]